MKKQILTSELFECRIPFLKETFNESVYPWEILPKIKDLINALIKTGIEGYTELREGVLIGKDVEIDRTATIIAPAIIGHGSTLRPGAFIRGSVIIGEGCVIGNSSELKNSILLDGAQVPHYNYVGDSILGNRAHMGAGSICSNLKADGKNVVIHSDRDIESGLRKLGAILGDGADIGCGCVLNPGTVIGKRTSVYPLLPLRGVFPADCIVKANDNVVKRR